MQYKVKSSKPAEHRALRLMRLRIAQCRRWSRTLKGIVPVAAAVFIAAYGLSYFDVHLGFSGLAAAAGIASAAGAFLLDRHIEEMNLKLEFDERPIEPLEPENETPRCL